MYKPKKACFFHKSVVKFTVKRCAYLKKLHGKFRKEKGADFMYSSAYVWAKILSYLEERMTSTMISASFDDAEVVELNEEQLILYSQNEFRREIIRRRCTDYIQDALKEIFNSNAKLVVLDDNQLKIKKQIQYYGSDIYGGYERLALFC